jgi:agmatine deiminase
MPAEWEVHAGTWLQWPHDQERLGFQLQLEGIWLAMVDALHQHESVYLIVADERQRDHVAHQLEYFAIGLEGVHFHIVPTNDVWARDNGPIFVTDKNGEVVIIDWEFNGWGNRFPHELDNQVPSRLAQRLGMRAHRPGMILEGGAVDVNGSGSFMATRSSILDPHRNPGMDQPEVEGILRKYLGVRHFIWLTGAGRGECEAWGDDTDSHIDLVAHFTAESTVLYNWTEDRSDPRWPMFARTRDELRSATNESGTSLTLVPLPVPQVHRVSAMASWHQTTLTVGAYSNYLVANGVVLVPVYGQADDERAKAIIQEQFPRRQVVGIDVVALIQYGGAIGCVTQPQPLAMPKGRHSG